MSNKVAVIGTTFMDCKGFAKNDYSPKGRNQGLVEFVHGGVGRNVAENLGILGCNPYFISTIDNNGLGEEIKDNLVKSNVNTEYILPVNKDGMGMWLALLDTDGDLAGSISRMPDFEHLAKYMDSYAEKFAREFKHVLLEIDLEEKITKKIIQACKKYQTNVYAVAANMKVVLESPDLLKDLNCFICNEIEASKLFDTDFSKAEIHNIQSTLKDYVKENNMNKMVITLGERGSVFYDNSNNNSGYTQAVETEVIDTSGAGDAFFSGTCMALINDFSLKDSTFFGAKFASLTISAKNNNPNRDDQLQNYIEEIRNK